MKDNNNDQKNSPVTTVERSAFRPLSLRDIAVAQLPAEHPTEILRPTYNKSTKN